MEGVYYAYESAPMSSAGVRARTGQPDLLPALRCAAALEARAEQNLWEAFLASSLDSGSDQRRKTLAIMW